MTYYESANKDAEIHLICRTILNDIENWNEDKFSISDLVFKTGRSPATIRNAIAKGMTGRGYEFAYEANPEMCEPDLDEEIQIPDQHVRVYVRFSI